VTEDTVSVALDRARRLDDGTQTATMGPCEPLVEGAAGPAELFVVERLREGLLEQVRSVERLVVRLYLREPLPLLAFQVPRILEQRVSAALDETASFRAGERAHL